MERERGLGVLCHISSLPNEYGIGSLGKEAYDFVDLLKKSNVKYWQILPLQQTGYGDSPYQSVCCTSGNPYFIDIVALKKQGLLDDEGQRRFLMLSFPARTSSRRSKPPNLSCISSIAFKLKRRCLSLSSMIGKRPSLIALIK